MSRQPLVSIVINCFNGEKYLREALDSVIKQTYENWEIIFWDNQSTDKSAEIFKSYQDKRLKYFLATSHTSIVYEARNDALKKTNGEFIAFLDVDDWWLPDKLNKQIPLFEDPEVGLVYGKLWYFFEKKNKKKIFKKKDLPTGMIVSELLRENVIGSPTYIIKKKALESLNYYFNDHFHIIGDYDFYVRFACKWKFNCVQTPIAVARIHGQNESLIKRNVEINEMKIWYEEAKKNPVLSSLSEFSQIPSKISYLEIMESILQDGFKKSILMVAEYPLSFNKIKLLIALFMPNFLLKKIKNY